MIIAVEGVSYSYGSHVALRSLDYHLNARGLFGVLGPNGSGKSTLFRLLSTLIRPTEGRLEVGGFDAVRMPHEVRRRIGVVFQSNSLDKHLTVAENLQAQGYLYGLTGRAFAVRRDECLERLGLMDRRDSIVKTLSGGLARRVEIAKALLHKPSILLLDEPSTGLDPGARRELWSFLGAQDGVTVLMTTHLLDEAARCERLLLLHQGRRVLEGSPEELVATVGGEVIEFETSDARALAAGLAEHFGWKPVESEGAVRVEVEKAHRLAAEAVEALPGLISGVRFHRPTLEDVFLRHTGARLSA